MSTFQFSEPWHEFEPEEQLLERSARRRLPELPFSLDEAVTRYIEHLPERPEPLNPYPWRDRAWQGEWLWQRGGLSRREARFWFVALTDTERRERSRESLTQDDALARAFDDDEFSAAEAERRLRLWFESERCALGGRFRPYLHAHLARLLAAMYEADEAFAIWRGALPGAEGRHGFEHLEGDQALSEARRLKFQRARRAVLEASLQAPLRGEEDAYAAIRLLERFPDDASAEFLCEALAQERDRWSPTLWRDAVNLHRAREPFARWFNATGRYHIAAEMIPSIALRGGEALVSELSTRVASSDDAFLNVALKDLVRLRSRHAVEAFLRLLERPRFSAAARSWLTAPRGGDRVRGLLEVWLRGDEMLRRDQAKRLLKEIVARGRSEGVLACLTAHFSSQDSERVQAEFLGGTLE